MGVVMTTRGCVVTGGAGFVGSRLIRALNDGGCDRIVLVDSFARRPGKLDGVSSLRVADFLDYFAVDAWDVEALDRRLPPLDGIFHIGAWTDVLETDVTKMLHYNFEHARRWIELGQRRSVPVIYGSTSALYGTSRLCRVDDAACERPLNAYGYSKLLLDRWLRARLETLPSRVVGFRFFNVFGPGEEHKAHNASIPTRFFQFLRDQGHIDLFESEIRRDYIHVDDVARVLLRAWQSDQPSGVYNLGSGIAIAHREIAETVARVARDAGLPVDPEPIRPLPMPEALRARFQFYTRADGVLPWVAEIVSAPLEKMVGYWAGRARAQAGDGQGSPVPKAVASRS
jgi:ADP-L-glycero-D-manno-heptose 6-epimerase